MYFGEETGEGHACEMKQRETLADAKKGILTREDGPSTKKEALLGLCAMVAKPRSFWRFGKAHTIVVEPFVRTGL